MTMRSGVGPHLLAGMSESEYVSSGLADSVAQAIEAVLIDQDRTSPDTKSKPTTFRRR